MIPEKNRHDDTSRILPAKLQRVQFELSSCTIDKDKHHAAIVLMLRQRFISVYRSHSDESGARTADDGKVGILWESLLSLRNLHLDSINPIGFQLNGRVYLGFCQISSV